MWQNASSQNGRDRKENREDAKSTKRFLLQRPNLFVQSQGNRRPVTTQRRLLRVCLRGSNSFQPSEFLYQRFETIPWKADGEF